MYNLSVASDQFLYRFSWDSFRLWSVLLGAGSCFVLGVLAFLKNKSAPLNRAFFFFVVFLGLWNILDLSFILCPPAVTEKTLRLSYFFAVLVVPSFYVLCREFTGHRYGSNRQLKSLWATTVLLLSLVPTPWIIAGIRTDPYVMEQPGVLFPLFALYLMGWTILAFSFVLRGFLHTTGVKRNQLRYVLMAFFFLYLAAGTYIANTVFPKFPPVYYVPEVFANVLLATAVVRYRLMDINLVFRYGTVYSVLALALGVPLGLLGIWWAGSWKAGLLGFLAPWVGTLGSAGLMPALTKIIDHFPLFRGRYEQFRDIGERESRVRRSSSLEEWRERLSSEVASVLKAEPVRLWSFNPRDPWGPSLETAFQKHPILVREFLNEILPAAEASLVDQGMAVWGAQLLVGFSDERGALFSVLSVGPKHEEGVWNDMDLTALWTLARAGEETYRDLRRREVVEQQKRLTALGAMASVVSHEIKTPLAVIQNSTTFLSERISQAGDEKARKHLAIIGSQVDSLRSIITGVLDYTRARELKPQKGSLESLVRNVMVSLPLPGGVEVSIQGNGPFPDMYFDAEEVKQAVRNVVMNALEAMPKGGRLSVWVRNERNGVLLEFSDTGVGISEEALVRVWEPFYTSKGTGTGLGLAVVKKIMDRHRGEVDLKSVPGKGTTVGLWFPKGGFSPP